jgi:hypothetical protein
LNVDREKISYNNAIFPSPKDITKYENGTDTKPYIRYVYDGRDTRHA